MDYENLTVVEALPDFFRGPGGREEVFRRLAGAKIVRIGSAAEKGIEGGGLILDYELEGEVYRLVFAFTELGMWVKHDSFSEPIRMNLSNNAS